MWTSTLDFFFSRSKALKPLAQKKRGGLFCSEALKALKPPSQVKAGLRELHVAYGKALNGIDEN